MYATKEKNCYSECRLLRCFRDPIRVLRIENRVPRISENDHRVPKIRENRVPRISEVGSLQFHTGYPWASAGGGKTGICPLGNWD